MAATIRAESFDGDDYRPMLDAVRERFAAATVAGAPLFTTDVDPEALWDTFLSGLPAHERQHHRCHCCRHFVQRYGGLVTIDVEGVARPALFDEAPGQYAGAFRAMARAVRSARVNGVFVTSEKTLGTPATPDPKRGVTWHHFSVLYPTERRHTSRLKAAHEVAAEKREEYGMLCRGLADFGPPVVASAAAVVASEALYGGEKVEGPLRWLSGLHAAREGKRGPARDNVTWLAVATAPPGFCHVRSTMAGTLLEDLASGLSGEAVKRRFGEKMNPLQYRRPSAPPTAGNVAQAERAVETLGIAASLKRRFARLEDLRPLWVPPPPAPVNTGPGSVFGHLLGRPPGVPSTEMVGPTLTWDKFRRTVLSDAREIKIRVPSHGHFMAMVTAVDPDAPPILQWDREGARNPVSWYVYPQGSMASQWNLLPGWADVTAVTLMPFMYDGSEQHGQHGAGAMFVVKGCRDTRQSGAALFPEILKSELHSVRSTIEAYSRRATLEGRDEATACGLEIRKGQRVTASLEVRVVGPAGVATTYRIDRWD